MTTPLNKKVAQRYMNAMAFDRRTFIDKVEGRLTGALGEFYKAQLAKKNGYTEWTTHWMSEVRMLLEVKFRNDLLHPIRGFSDRKKP